MIEMVYAVVVGENDQPDPPPGIKANFQRFSSVDAEAEPFFMDHREIVRSAAGWVGSKFVRSEIDAIFRTGDRVLNAKVWALNRSVDSWAPQWLI